MGKSLMGFNYKEHHNIISIAIFGSYNTEYWVSGRSDIDIFILIDQKIDVMLEFDIEDEILPLLKDYFSYDNIHLTFIYMKDFSEELAIKYVESKDKIIFDENKEIDFRLYVNKYRRNNQWIEDLIRRDTKRRGDGVDSVL